MFPKLSCHPVLLLLFCQWEILIGNQKKEGEKMPFLCLVPPGILSRAQCHFPGSRDFRQWCSVPWRSLLLPALLAPYSDMNLIQEGLPLLILRGRLLFQVPRLWKPIVFLSFNPTMELLISLVFSILLAPLTFKYR